MWSRSLYNQSALTSRAIYASKARPMSSHHRYGRFLAAHGSGDEAKRALLSLVVVNCSGLKLCEALALILRKERPVLGNELRPDAAAQLWVPADLVQGVD